MSGEGNKLYIYEALELRGQYKSHLKTLKECLPEDWKNRRRLSFGRDDDNLQPSEGFDANEIRREIKKI